MSDILAETPDRFLLLPVRDERAWAFYQDAVACFWTAQELDLTHDRYSELLNTSVRRAVYRRAPSRPPVDVAASSVDQPGWAGITRAAPQAGPRKA